MTPEQKLKRYILEMCEGFENHLIDELNVEALYEDAKDNCDSFWDVFHTAREGEFETTIDSEYDRNYENKSVAARMFDGSYVGWTFWYGGGKHGQPQSIDWMPYAYELNCVEQERMVIVRQWSKIDELKEE